MRIKNWSELQHYRDRRPPWVRFYHSILDDVEIGALSDRAYRVLTYLWLIASEDKDLEGNLPDAAAIAWKCHMNEAAITKALQELEPWLEPVGSNVLASCSADATSETEESRGETETETKTKTEKHFDVFWFEYPKKTGKKAARAAWDKAKDKPRIDAIVRAIKAAKRSEQWRKDGGKFIPYPATWLNRGCWDDEITDTTDKTGRSHVSRKVTICGGCGADCSASFTYRDGVPLCDRCYEGGGRA